MKLGEEERDVLPWLASQPRSPPACAIGHVFSTERMKVGELSRTLHPMRMTIKSQGIGENTPRKNVSQTHYHQRSLVPRNRFKFWLPQSQAGRAGL